MRENIRGFLSIAAKYCSFPDPIVEVGSYIVKGQEKIADLRAVFPGKDYVGTDMRTGLGVDRIENVEYLKYDNESVASLICIDTLQCVRDLCKAREEMFRVLEKEGLLFIASAMHAPYNIYYFYNYWRFTPKGFDYMMDKFPHRMMFMQGEKDNPHTMIGIASKDQAKIAAFHDQKFLEEVVDFDEEPFYGYNVNHEHEKLLAKDKSLANNM